MMRAHHEIQGAIYDVDDTLLDNQPNGDPLSNLHQQARLEALHRVGNRYDIPTLIEVGSQENFDSFAKADTHTVAGALWVVLREHDLRTGSLDLHDPLLREMLDIKNKAYGDLLAQFGKPHVGAVEFVRELSSQYNLDDYNAIASTATGVDVRTFLGMTGLKPLFPDSHIIALEDVDPDKTKPHKQAFDKAFLSLGLPNEARHNILAFEDDPRGMISAKKAGLTVCAITTRYSRKFLDSIEIRPDFIADSWAEFRSIFIFPPSSE